MVPPITDALELILAYINFIRTVPRLHETVADMRSIANDEIDNAARIEALKRLERSSSFILVLEHLQSIGTIQGPAGPHGLLSGHREPEGAQIPVDNSGCDSSAPLVRHASDRGSSSRDDVVRSIPHSAANVKLFNSQEPQVIVRQESQAKTINTRKARGQPCERCRQQRKKCSLSDFTEKTGNRCALCKAHNRDCIFTAPKKTTRRTRDGRATNPSSPTSGTEVPTNSYNVASGQGSSTTVTFQTGASDAPLTGTNPDFGMPNFDSDTPIMGDMFQTNLSALHQGWDVHCHHAATASRSILSEGNPDSATGICLPDSFTSYLNDPLFTSY